MMLHFNCVSAFAAVVVLISPAHALLANSSINSQTRLAYAGSTGMTVSWNTFAQIPIPTVRYGLSPQALTWVATSTISVTYNTSLTYNNHVKITGLQPDTLYYYLPTTLIQSSQGAGPYTFRTSKVAGDHTPFSIAVVADMGTIGPEGLYTSAGTGVSPNNILAPGEINTIESLSSFKDQFEFLWHVGDIAYADAWLKEEIQGFEPNTTIANGYKVYESILNSFYDELTPITTSKAYMVGPGNHEANCDNGGTGGYTASICMPGQTNFTGYINHFRMPSAESGGTGNFWYSFDYGMTHFVQFDTETDLGHGLIGPDEPAGGAENSGPFALLNAQSNWLAADLANVNRVNTPWVVVGGHRPWYTSGSVCTACQSAFESVFVQNNVDLVLSGHFHVFERNAPIKNGTADPKELNNPSSPWYITNGIAGHYDGLDSFTLPLQSYQRYGLSTNNSIYGWSKLTFHNCTHLTHELINSANGTVLDSATLFKNRTCSSSSPTSSSTKTSSATSSSSKTSSATTSSTSKTSSTTTSSTSKASSTTTSSTSKTSSPTSPSTSSATSKTSSTTTSSTSKASSTTTSSTSKTSSPTSPSTSSATSKTSSTTTSSTSKASSTTTSSTSKTSSPTSPSTSSATSKTSSTTTSSTSKASSTTTSSTSKGSSTTTSSTSKTSSPTSPSTSSSASKTSSPTTSSSSKTSSPTSSSTPSSTSKTSSATSSPTTSSTSKTSSATSSPTTSSTSKTSSATSSSTSKASSTTTSPTSSTSNPPTSSTSKASSATTSASSKTTSGSASPSVSPAIKLAGTTTAATTSTSVSSSSTTSAGPLQHTGGASTDGPSKGLIVIAAAGLLARLMI